MEGGWGYGIIGSQLQRLTIEAEVPPIELRTAAEAAGRKPAPEVGRNPVEE